MGRGAVERASRQLHVELERLGLALPGPPRLGAPGTPDLQVSVGEIQAHHEGGDEMRAAGLLQELLAGGATCSSGRRPFRVTAIARP